MTEPAAPLYADLARHLTLVLRNREAAHSIAAAARSRSPASGAHDAGAERRARLGQALRVGLAHRRVGKLRSWLGALPVPEVERPTWLPSSEVGIWHDLGRLPAGQRAALVLNLLEGCPPDEVAHLLSITPGTAAAWLVTARLHLNPPPEAEATASLAGHSSMDEELRAELRSLEQSVPIDDSRAAASYRATRSWATLVRTTATVLAATVVVAAGTRLLAGGIPGGEDPSPGASGLSSPSESDESLPSESLPPIPSRVSWDTAPFSAAVVRGATLVDGTWILTGRRGAAAAAWTSGDMHTWKAARVAGSAARGQFLEMAAVAAHGDLLVALGSAAASARAPATRSLAWVSGDGGLSWSPLALPAVRGVLTSVASGASGFVALTGWRGCCGSQTPGTVLFSADGRTWRAVSVPGLGDGSVNAVASDGGRFVLVGQHGAPTSTTTGAVTRPLAWSSDDGEHWTAATIAGLEPGIPLAPVAISASPWGFAAAGLVGAPGTGNPQGIATWSSPDGARWGEPQPVTDAPNPDALVLAAGSNRLTMAIGLAEAPGQSWSTIDGTDWWPDDAGPQIHGPTIALSDTQLLLASNCAAYLSDCPGPQLFMGSFDPEPAHE